MAEIEFLDNGTVIDKKQLRKEMKALMLEIMCNYKTMCDVIGYYSGVKKFSRNSLQKNYDSKKTEKTFINDLVGLRAKNMVLHKEYSRLEGIVLN